MHPLLKILFAIFGSALILYIFTSIASFLQISFERYINYLLFFFALMIFYIFLPQERGAAFK
jgi:hypothetical protein|tara:strand:+ start:1263 stop:1448 length:186 start_codon:yes stop_codon:yes gene_type:complete